MACQRRPASSVSRSRCAERAIHDRLRALRQEFPMTTFTRRELVAGTAAGVGTVSFMATGAAAADSGSAVVSPGVCINTVLRINGRELRVPHDIRASLL